VPWPRGKAQQKALAESSAQRKEATLDLAAR
jgi:hypothetical protein